MTCFKVIKNGNVVDAGCVFLKWNSKRQRMYVCDVNEGQFVQSFGEKNVYHADWMKEAPKEAKGYEPAEVVVIEKAELDDIITLLQEGEIIPKDIVEEETPVIHLAEPEPEKVKPMSISEMREMIMEQQKQISALMKQLNK